MAYSFRKSSSISDGGPAISTAFTVSCEGKDGISTTVTQGTTRVIPLTIPVANVDIFYAKVTVDCTVVFKNSDGDVVLTWNAKASRTLEWDNENGFDLPFDDGIGSHSDDIVSVTVTVPAGDDADVDIVFGTNSV